MDHIYLDHNSTTPTRAEVVEAMVKIGEAMPRSLKETADDGLAMTPTGCRIRNELYQIR